VINMCFDRDRANRSNAKTAWKLRLEDRKPTLSSA
jgi:hypothetical protein